MSDEPVRDLSNKSLKAKLVTMHPYRFHADPSIPASWRPSGTSGYASDKDEIASLNAADS
jgi:hypothetical protein